MTKLDSFRVLNFTTCLVLAIPFSAVETAEPKAQCKVGESGVSSIIVNGVEWIVSGAPIVHSIDMEETVKDGDVFKVAFSSAPNGIRQSSFDVESNLLKQTYEWGSVAYQFVLNKNGLDISIVIENHSKLTVSNF